MKEDRIEATEQIASLEPPEVRPEFPNLKTGIKAGPDISNQPQP